jgi:hypothetical protein
MIESVCSSKAISDVFKVVFSILVRYRKNHRDGSLGTNTGR